MWWSIGPLHCPILSMDSFPSDQLVHSVAQMMWSVLPKPVSGGLI